jgi:hypothetical protein
MGRIEEQEHVFSSFPEKKAFHSIIQLPVSDILETCPTALGPASPLYISQSHFANVEIPRILSRSIKMISRLNKFRTATPPSEAVIDVSCRNIPSFRKRREPGPNSGVQQMRFNCFIYLTG